MDVIVHFNADRIVEFASQVLAQAPKPPDAPRKRRHVSNGLEIDNLSYTSVNQALWGNHKVDSLSELPQDANGVLDSPRIVLVDRNLQIECVLPIPVKDLKNAIATSKDGFRQNAKSGYDFTTTEVSLLFPRSDEPLLSIKNKPGAVFKKTEQLLSLNLVEFPWRDIRNEVYLVRRRVANLVVTGPIFSILIPSSNSRNILISMSYKIEISQLINANYTVEMINGLHSVIQTLASPIPTSNDTNMLSKSDADPSESPNPQLFYRVVADHTSKMTPVEDEFDIPELNTSLLSFQRKTLQWLLHREGVNYDYDSGECLSIPFFLDLFLKRSLSLLNGAISDDELACLDVETQIVLNKLSYGWNLILLHSHVYWYNKYTGNLGTKEYIVHALLQLYKPDTRLPGKGLLAEEMGLGKTVEITALILANKRPSQEVNVPLQVTLQPYNDVKTIHKAQTTLIIAPDSILKQWIKEIVNLAPSLAVTVYQGIDKYPKLNNNAHLIAKYLRGFDVVFTTYSVISSELDYALYSSRRKPTRGASQKRSATEVNSDPLADDDIKRYRDLFQLSLQTKKPKVANMKFSEDQIETDYENALQQEIERAIRHSKIPDIFGNHDYQSPIMLSHFWRVVLDEVQMVSSRFSRAFQSAALIPTYHSWGVSGTPVKKHFGDLHSILRFLKVYPFENDYLAKSSWEKLTTLNPYSLSDNSDFIKLWSTYALRHTKDMVKNDIKLPPQNRILMSIPFNPVEQANYTQIMEDCLAAIRLNEDGLSITRHQETFTWKLSNPIILQMKQTLLRLRQITCNPQVGNLNLRRLESRISKLYHSKVVQTVQQLKTLEDVLADMLDNAYDEIAESERDSVQLSLEMAEYFEFLLMPELSLNILRVGAFNTERIIYRYQKQLEQWIEVYKERLQKDGQLDNATEFEFDDISNKITKSEKSDAIVRLGENIKRTRLKLRLWYITLHKFYFLLASCHFQCYDEEYQQKIGTNKRIDIRIAGEIKELVEIEPQVGEDEVSLVVSGISTKEVLPCNPLKDFVPLEGDDLPIEKSKDRFQEQFYYDYAEKIREKILDSSINSVSSNVRNKITSRELYFAEPLLDSGEVQLPKTSKKLFKYLPLIDLDHLSDYIVGIHNKLLFDKIGVLVSQLNAQTEIINEWMDKMISLLCKPLLSHDKTPDGEEYSESLDDQDRLTSYFKVLLLMLEDRSLAISGQESQAKKKQQKKDLAERDLNSINDKDFLKLLQDLRKKVKPSPDISLKEYILEGVESDDLKSEAFSSYDVVKLEQQLISEFDSRLRRILENQKTADILLQKEVSGTFNAVFNSRIEYFKQLQQISDSVGSLFNHDLAKLDVQVIVDKLQSYTYRSRNNQMKTTRLISKYRYLQTLVRPEDKSEIDSKVDISDESFECVICQSVITIGSLTQCGHKYCKECLERWLANSRYCPMCKTYITESSVYNFTHHKLDLKMNALENEKDPSDKLRGDSNDDSSLKERVANLHVIYKNLDSSALEEIQLIELKSSYSSKVDMIIKQVLFLKRQDPAVQIVVFSQWQDLLYIIATALREVDVSYLASHGTLTPGIGAGRPRNKYDSVELFKNPENNITCFLLNSRAQAAGLTLTNATHMFLCEPLVNTSMELQAISRIHRIGQTKPTTVWMFAIENTVEENIVLLSTQKRLNYFDNGRSQSNSLGVENELDKAESMSLISSSNDLETVASSDLWTVFFGTHQTETTSPIASQFTAIGKEL